ncbi:Tripartite tricarboxylate transporter family receptor [compost metagenome]
MPTFAEAGYADEPFRLTGPITLMAPAKTPQDIIDRLGRETASLVASADMQRRIVDMGAEPLGNTPAQAEAAYKAYLPVVLKLTADTGVTLD